MLCLGQGLTPIQQPMVLTPLFPTPQTTSSVSIRFSQHRTTGPADSNVASLQLRHLCPQFWRS
ncbi:hypothetical protein RHMOL_Rhmol06G0188000 [Rhododendron molle]|uniref:Uncharacterized protein n=1 Tax=Rhododendron molle TaxID=49168 RepID=A0ACC0NDP4_RHOML|nr:hypothetical protein RHMOL_Rhmol06G0188000 [Rhododendron molle]